MIVLTTCSRPPMMICCPCWTTSHLPDCHLQVESVADPPSDLDISHARLKQDGCTGEVVFIVYDSVKVALAAVAKFHGQSLGQPTKEAAKRQKVDKDGADAAQLSLWARQVSGEGLHLKKWRLIIRNLSFQVHSKASSADADATVFAVPAAV